MMPVEALELPFGFEAWGAFWQAALIGLLTFVSEDATTVGAAVLASQSLLGATTAFLGAFLGIWAGDAGLYWIARGVGGAITGRRWCRSLVSESRMREARRWFERRGLCALVLCRFVPGTRLPTYLVSGLLRIGFDRFLIVTGVCALVWTALVFAIAAAIGSRIHDGLDRVGHIGWEVALTVIPAYLSVRLAGKVSTRDGRRKLATSIARLSKWEFWPAWLFYPPVVLNYLWLSVRFRGPMLPTIANPGMEAGGVIGESKFATLDELQCSSPEFTARSFLVGCGEPNSRVDEICRAVDQGRLTFPFIVKPDQGQRGVGVRLVGNVADLSAYLRSNPSPVVVQEFVEGPHEIGVFYYRFPHETTGHVFSITLKEFPALAGDGHHTLRRLIRSDARARFLANVYEERFSDRLDEVPEEGEVVPLVLAGNHAQGCIFRDGAHLETGALAARIDAISQSINGFFIGRYDLRYRDEAELAAGRGFKIIELNGASAEATSIYDPENSLWRAYATLFRQWRLVFEIAASNRSAGHVSESMGRMLMRVVAFRRMAADYPRAD